jgi:hypothetical protein
MVFSVGGGWLAEDRSVDDEEGHARPVASGDLTVRGLDFGVGAIADGFDSCDDGDAVGVSPVPASRWSLDDEGAADDEVVDVEPFCVEGAVAECDGGGCGAVGHVKIISYLDNFVK